MKKNKIFYKNFWILTSFVAVISCGHALVADTMPLVEGMPLSKSQNLLLLNTTFEESPSAILRIELANRAIREALEAVSKRNDVVMIRGNVEPSIEDRNFAQEQLKKILEPVQKFFATIMNFLPVVKPLVDECYRAHAIDARSAFLTKFFESKKTIKDFCEKEVTSSQELIKACNEFLCFFADLNASLSSKARQKSQELLQKVNNDKRKESQKK